MTTQVDRDGQDNISPIKFPVRAATTGVITLNDAQIVDTNVSLVQGDRVLVRAQTDTTENGIYVVQEGADWIRAGDMDSEDDLFQMMQIPVQEGLVFGLTNLYLVTPSPSFTSGLSFSALSTDTLNSIPTTVTVASGVLIPTAGIEYHLTDSAQIEMPQTHIADQARYVFYIGADAQSIQFRVNDNRDEQQFKTRMREAADNTLKGTISVGNGSGGSTFAASALVDVWEAGGFVNTTDRVWTVKQVGVAPSAEPITSNTAREITTDGSQGITWNDGDQYEIGLREFTLSPREDGAPDRIEMIFDAASDSYTITASGFGISGILNMGEYLKRDTTATGVVDFTQPTLEKLLLELDTTLASVFAPPFIEVLTASENLGGASRSRTRVYRPATNLDCNIGGSNEGRVQFVVNAGPANVILKPTTNITTLALMNGTATEDTNDITMPAGTWAMVVREQFSDTNATDASIAYVLTPFTTVTK